MTARWAFASDSTSSNVQLNSTLAPTGTWSGVTSQPFATTAAYGIAFGEGKWVAAGNGKLFVASDVNGTWSTATSYGSTNLAYAATYGNGYFLTAVANPGEVRYAADPTGTWSQAFAAGSPTYDIFDVSYGNGYYLAASFGTPYVKYATTPGGTWSNATGLRANSNYRVRAGGDGYFVAGGVGASGNFISYTTDPTSTWTNASASWPAGGQIRALAWGGGYWVAGGLSGVMRYATSPSATWGTPTSVGFTSHIFDIAYLDGLWVAVGVTSGNRVDVRATTDPTGTWTAATVPVITGSARGVAVGGGDRRVWAMRQAVTRAAVF